MVHIETKTGWKEIVSNARKIFSKKDNDYGRSWTVLRTKSLTDQILIKVLRIRELQETKKQLVKDPPEDDYIGVINYCIMALMLDHEEKGFFATCPSEELLKKYDLVAEEIFELMQKKNHDYGEAWREFREETFTDLILQKLFRLRQIQDNNNIVTSSEPPSASFQDIVNYSIFAIIKLKEALG